MKLALESSYGKVAVFVIHVLTPTNSGLGWVATREAWPQTFLCERDLGR
jgi:hypothetical protein